MSSSGSVAVPAPEFVAQAEPETEQERRRGRPRTKNGRDEHLNFYVTRQERRMLDAYTRKFGYRTLSDALREIFTAGVHIVPAHCR
jgi:hypothetical protein